MLYVTRVREEFTQDITKRFVEQNPGYDAIACGVRHSIRGEYITLPGIKFEMLLMPLFYYDVYLIRHGDWARFELQGDGGYINWAMYGSRYKREGNIVTWEGDAAEQYLKCYPDVAKANSPAWDHYVRHGRKERRGWPSHASKVQYLADYPDVAQNWNADPYLHYLKHGRKEPNRIWPE
ncbi:hypothetical protein Vretimale_184 [Volvox reticuliferus]|uniref:Uncharacterized protein n=1 Tax=Volvox reticuliferus TaxID=1737510 RepID=A0A8J4FP79_9CHLO|nr:hypothetical protein Vretifemale_8236 [Volvox reticuliferus]GIL93949.1 hypothetical protein Vretimale_184 [Volvox reticuliferus]